MKLPSLGWSRLAVGTKVIVAVACALLATVGVLLVVMWHYSSVNRTAAITERMRSLLAQTEVTRDRIEGLHRAGAIDLTRLAREAQARLGDRPLRDHYRQTDLLKAVPIVAAWESAELGAKAEGWDFRVVGTPERSVRNAGHAAVEGDRAMFAALAAGGEEYRAVDRESGVLTVARPVRLQAGCLRCHGDPANSPTGDGRDLLGIPMEGLKEGDLQGAFVVTAALRTDEVVASTMGKMAWAGGATLVVILGGGSWCSTDASWRGRCGG